MYTNVLSNRIFTHAAPAMVELAARELMPDHSFDELRFVCAFSRVTKNESWEVYNYATRTGDWVSFTLDRIEQQVERSDAWGDYAPK